MSASLLKKKKKKKSLKLFLESHLRSTVKGKRKQSTHLSKCGWQNVPCTPAENNHDLIYSITGSLLVRQCLLKCTCMFLMSIFHLSVHFLWARLLTSGSDRNASSSQGHKERHTTTRAHAYGQLTTCFQSAWSHKLFGLREEAGEAEEKPAQTRGGNTQTSHSRGPRPRESNPQPCYCCCCCCCCEASMLTHTQVLHWILQMCF